MEIEQENIIREKVLKLSQIKDLKKSSLNSDSLKQDDDYFLSEDLKERLKEKLKEKGFKYNNDLQIGYSFSYSQGDGFNFIGTITTEKAVFNIKKDSYHYEHSHTTEINLISLKVKKDYINYYDLTDKQVLKAEDILKDFREVYHSICKELEKLGYEMIEEQQKENILRDGFYNFLILNNINQNKELYDFDYSTEQKKGFILISDSGNTNIKGLWIKDFKIKRTYKTIIYKPLLDEINYIL